MHYLKSEKLPIAMIHEMLNDMMVFVNMAVLIDIRFKVYAEE